MSGISRTAAIKLVAPDLGDAIVVAALGYSSWCLKTAVDRHESFYLRGAMGSAVPVALGIAQAQPGRTIVVLEGDGGVLMNLGALTTVSVYAPANLVIVVWDDHKYRTTGGQPTHTARGIDLAAIARAAGIPRVASVGDGDAFARAFRAALRERGPHVLVVDTADESEPPNRKSILPALNLHQVMESLGTCDCHPAAARRSAS